MPMSLGLERLRLLSFKFSARVLMVVATIPCLHLVQAFDDGVKLLEATERHGLEGIVSKRRDAPYRSGECRDWVKVKSAA